MNGEELSAPSAELSVRSFAPQRQRRRSRRRRRRRRILYARIEFYTHDDGSLGRNIS
jgi:hypothetical protein